MQAYMHILNQTDTLDPKKLWSELRGNAILTSLNVYK